jgi:hypothetical protein
MSDTRDAEALAKTIVGATTYLTLATADANGRPWASPVWFATADCHEFVWASKPGARHSRNLAVRPEAGIVIFDSRQPPGTGEAFYASVVARELPESELDRALEIYASQSLEQSLPAWNRADVQAPARHRLYHAIAVERFILSSTDERIPVSD